MKKALSLAGCILACSYAGAQNMNPSLGYTYSEPIGQKSFILDEKLDDSHFHLYFPEKKDPTSKSQAIRYAISELNETLPFEIPFAKLESAYSEPIILRRKSGNSFREGFSYDADVSLDKVGLTFDSGDGFFSGVFTDIDFELKTSLSPDYSVRFKRDITDYVKFQVTVDEKDTKAYLTYQSDTLDFRAIPSQLAVGLVKFVTFQK